MPSLYPKSIRGRVTLMAAAATAIAMALIVVAMGLATRAILEEAIADSLRERLDQARDAVAAGDYALVIDLAGNEVVQVIDADGNVVAGSRNARGLSAIDDGEDDESEVDELEFELEDDASASSAESSAASGGAGASASEAPSAPTGSSVGESGDADDGDDADDDDGKGNDAGAAAADDADDDDDADDADDDADDDDGDERVAKASASASGLAGGTSRSAFPAWPIFRGVAWADEPRSEPASDSLIDAASVLGTDGPYLILKEQVDSPDGPMTVVAVTSLSQATRSAEQMMWLLAAIMAGVLVAVVALTWVLTGRTLHPVEEMRAKAASITAENLSERIEVPSGDNDLAPLAETLNGMLARVERSLEDEKRFISDASHELKSPVAATAVILDSLRAHPEGADVARAVDDLARENARMASIVSDMLTLTRYDEGRLNCTPEPVDVMDLVLEEAMSLAARSDVEVDVSDVQPLTCRADADLLRHVLRNLLENAARYAEGLVKVSCEPGGTEEDGERQARGVVIFVSDDGPGIDPEDRERAFGRFVCLDDRSGTGLGLAVARTIAEAHGGTLSFVDSDLGGATARVVLP